MVDMSRFQTAINDMDIRKRIEAGGDLDEATLSRISSNRGLSNRLKEVEGRRGAANALMQQRREQELQTKLRDQQGQLSGQLFDQYQSYKPMFAEGTDFQAMANNRAGGEIERLRRAANQGQENQNRGLNRLLARSGSGNTASALFARQNAAQAQQDRLYDIEGQRTGLQESGLDRLLGQRNQDEARRGNLLSQYGSVAGGFQNPIQSMQLPGLDFTKQKSGWQKAAPKIGKFIGDRIAAGEQIAGQALGGMLCSRDFKDNIVDLDTASLLKTVNSIGVKGYTYKDVFADLVPAKERIGVIAEEMPKEFTDESGKTVDVQNVVFALMGAVQELSKKVKELERADNR